MQQLIRIGPRLSAAVVLVTTGSLVGCVAVDLRHDLDFERTVILDAGESGAGDLVIEIQVGDIEVHGTDGPTRVIAQLHEESPGVGELEWVDGRLVLDTYDGEARIGDVRIEVGTVHGDLWLETGVGDVSAERVDVRGSIQISVGAGDVSLVQLGGPIEVRVDSGVGDVRLRDLDAEQVTIEHGVGDLMLEGLSADRVHAGTGVGDIDLDYCYVDELEAASGIGDVSIGSSTVGHRQLEVGLGSISD
ncbi:MAG: DUF4097 family beta strand repeat-containing protein [Planctomycetota bacterium]